MNIPNRIKIEGMTFRVFKLSAKEMDSLKKEDETGSICGFTDFETAKILINDSYCEEMKEQTLMHEIVHICDSRMNPLTEEQIDNFARRLYAILKDNPKLFVDFQKKL